MPTDPADTRNSPHLGLTLLAWLHALRVHHWAKNLLLLAPLLAAHRIFEPDLWRSLAWAVAAFCLCASSVYIANDLFDLDSDRRHPRKRQRPFASGRLPLWQGVLAVPLLLDLEATGVHLMPNPFGDRSHIVPRSRCCGLSP